MVIRISFAIVLFWSAMWSINFYHQPDTGDYRYPSSGTCQDIIGHFFESPDLFTKYPELSIKLAHLVDMEPNFPEFYKNFVSMNNGKEPTLRDAFLYMYSLREKAILSYADLIAEVESLADPALDIFSSELKFSQNKLNKFKDLDHISNEISNDYKTKGGVITSIDDIIPMKDRDAGLFDETYYLFLKDRVNSSGFYGEYGELLVVGKTREKVITRGLLFEREPTPDNIYGVLISQQLRSLEIKLQGMEIDGLQSLVDLYGEGLLRHAKEYIIESGQNPDKEIVISKIMNMLYSKEIDLVAENTQGKVIWGEVKAYRKPITVETLTGKGHGKKTMLDQLIEHRALRDILGLAEDVKLRFISPLVDVAPDARQLIEEVGYEVLSFTP